MTRAAQVSLLIVVSVLVSVAGYWCITSTPPPGSIVIAGGTSADDLARMEREIESLAEEVDLIRATPQPARVDGAPVERITDLEKRVDVLEGDVRRLLSEPAPNTTNVDAGQEPVADDVGARIAALSPEKLAELSALTQSIDVEAEEVEVAYSTRLNECIRDRLANGPYHPWKQGDSVDIGTGETFAQCASRDGVVSVKFVHSEDEKLVELARTREALKARRSQITLDFLSRQQ